MEVQRLSTLAMASITSNLWSIHNPTPYIDGYTRYLHNKRNGELDNQRDMIREKLEGITEKILDIPNIPHHIALKISNALLYLVRDMIEWGKILCHGLEETDELNYCLHKTVLTPAGKVDRPKSVAKLIHDSYDMIYIRCKRIMLHTLVSSKQLEPFFQSISYKYNQNIVKTTKRLLQKMDINVFANKRNWSDEFKMHQSVCGSVDVLDFWYNTIQDQYKTEWICYVFVSILKFKNKPNFSEKIIYVHHHVENHVWQKLLIRHHDKIISELYINNYSDYCLLFYKQIMRWRPDATKEILKNLFKNIDKSLGYCGGRIMFECRKHTLLDIWSNTDNSIREEFVSMYYVFHCICGFWLCKDYEFVKVLLSDSIHSEQGRIDLIRFITLYNKIKEPKLNVIFLNKLYKDFNMQIPTYTFEGLTAFLVLHAQMLCPTETNFNYLFANRTDIITFKENITGDPKLMFEVINNFDCEREMNCSFLNRFLKWCYPCKNNVVSCMTQYLLNTDGMVEIYINYLFEKTIREKRYCDKTYGQCLNQAFNSKTVRSRLDQIVKNTDFVEKTLKYMMNYKYSEAMPMFLKRIRNKTEKNALIKSYLHSENGLKDVIARYIHTKGAYLRALTETDLRKYLRRYFLFRNYWLSDKEMIEEFTDYMIANSREVYTKHFKAPAEVDLLPHESVEQHITITNILYRLFLAALLNLEFIESFYYIKNNITVRYLNQLLSNNANFNALI